MSSDKDDYRSIVEEAVKEADKNSMDRSEMSRLLECLKEGGCAYDHNQPDSIACFSSNGRSQGPLEHKVVDLLKQVGLVNSETQSVPDLRRDLKRKHYFLSDLGRRYIDRFGTYGEGHLDWIDIEELNESITKLKKGS